MKNVKCLKELNNMDKKTEDTPKTKKEIEFVDISKSKEVFHKSGYDLSSLHCERHISDDVINYFSSLIMRRDRKILITNT